MTDVQQPRPDMPPPPLPRPRRRGFISRTVVRSFAFVVVTLCIIISVAACIMAIWDFADTDVLWRTVATCIVVIGGTVAFAIVNAAFGSPD
jgi:hypothetical protein